MTVGTIYKYFASKREIFLATQRDRMVMHTQREPTGNSKPIAK